MSSILRALRRAERHVHPRRPALVWPAVWRRDPAAIGLRRWVWMIAGALILVGGISGAVVGYRAWHTDSSPPLPSPPVAATPETGSPSAANRIPSGQGPTSGSPRSPLPAPMMGPPDPVFLKSVEQTVAQVTAAQAGAVASQAPPASGTASADPPRLTDYPPHPPGGAPELEIQAVIWAPLQDDRLVVVNGRFLHVGDPMDEVRIVAIEADGVVFQWRGQVWQQSHAGTAVRPSGRQ